ncbi:Putative transposase [Mycobacterium tuberculosis]|nr:Putative transposase [Mycobacterium tuberculosis]
MARLKVPEGWCVQAFRFTLNPTQTQAASLARHFGARRKAFNWTVTALKADIKAWRADGTESAKPSLRVLRKRWNTVKDQVCVNAQTGQVWWPECSKEAYADGIAGAVDAYWNWQSCRAGKRAGKTVGVPRFKKKGRDADRVCFTTGAMRVEPDRRHLTLPVIGTIRTYENTRRVERLIAKGRARVLAITVRRNGTRLDASVRVLVQRPQQRRVALPDSRVGVDVGVRRLATVADAEGTVLEQVPNPRPLDAALRGLRRVSRARSRCTKGSRRYCERTTELSRLHRRVNDVRTHHLHVLTTRLAKTHGRIVVEGLDAAGMLRQKDCRGRAPDGAHCLMQPWQPRAVTCPTRQAGTDRVWWSPTAGSHRRKPAMPAGMCKTSAGTKNGNATAVRSRTNVTTTPRSTSHATRNHLASSAQLGPPSSVEPTVRPGLARRVAVKRGRQPATRPANNPETGCKSSDH